MTPAQNTRLLIPFGDPSSQLSMAFPAASAPPSINPGLPLRSMSCLVAFPSLRDCVLVFQLVVSLTRTPGVLFLGSRRLRQSAKHDSLPGVPCPLRPSKIATTTVS